MMLCKMILLAWPLVIAALLPTVALSFAFTRRIDNKRAVGSSSGEMFHQPKSFFALNMSSDDDDDEPAAEEPAEAPAEEPAGEEPAGDDLSGLSGSVFVSGSSTVEPISIAVGDAFADLAQGVAVTVEGPGTGDGFAKFCNGESMMVRSSQFNDNSVTMSSNDRL